MKEKTLVEQIEEKFQNIEMLEDEYNQLLNITRDGKLRIFEWSGGEFGILWTEGDDLEEAGVKVEEDDEEMDIEDIAYQLDGITEDKLIEQIDDEIGEEKYELVELLDEAVVNNQKPFDIKKVEDLIDTYGFARLTKIARDNETPLEFRAEYKPAEKSFEVFYRENAEKIEELGLYQMHKDLCKDLGKEPKKLYDFCEAMFRLSEEDAL